MNMTMGSALPDWLTPVAWTYISLSLLSAALIAGDIYLRQRRHESRASELVWVTSALYLGPFALPVFASRRPASAAPGDIRPGRAEENPAIAVLPGGGASAVAHLIAVPLVAAVGWTIAGLAMWPMILVIAVLATLMLAVYQRSTSDDAAARRRKISVGAALAGALVTVLAFDVGMVGWMLVLHLNDLMPAVTEGSFWFLMQVGVIVGLITGYPAVKWLWGREESAVPA